MSFFNRKPFIAVIIVLAIFAFGILAFVNFYKKIPEVSLVKPVESTKETLPKHEIIGKSVEGRNLDAYIYGTGKTHLVFVGGVHGGYEWNSVLLAYAFKDYLDASPELIPTNLTITIIPSLNPDGVYKVVGKEGRFTDDDVSTDKKILASGRFNAREVDLNRNFDCKWKPKSTWQSRVVSGGSAPFSEPEAEALRAFLVKNHPTAVVFWHSKSNAVYASQCETGILPETLKIMNAYSEASGYPEVRIFDAYVTTGAADDWLAGIGIPAITVELKTHEAIEWEKNLAGIKALFEYYK